MDNETTIAEAADSDGESVEKRPIMLLLKRLIRNKQNTVMTNSQILEILKHEFDIDMTVSNELEVDIYIKIIKKYLKDWPQWEELERISTKLNSAKDYEAVTKVLNNKYKNLKHYLSVMLEVAKPLTKKALAEVDTDTKDETIDSSDVVMEVYCTRDQLNHLFFKKPRTDLNNSIFNISKIEPTKIILNTLSFESILNYWWMKIFIHLPTLIYCREIVYTHTHTLVNKARDNKPTAAAMDALDTRLLNRSKKVKDYPKSTLLNHFEKILKTNNNEEINEILKLIFNVIQTDLKDAPETLKVPSSYKKNLNRYKYIRYLYVENEENPCKRYDLQLEEVVVPSYQYFIGRIISKHTDALPPIQEWLKFECSMCKVKFQGSSDLMTTLQAHFSECHQNEPDWQCPNCMRLFGVDYLAKNRWNHDC